MRLGCSCICISFWDYQPKSGDSNTWKDMLSVREYFVNNCCWFIGSGNSIPIWNDPWIPGIPGFRPTRLQQSNIQVSLVSDLFVQGEKAWNIDLLQQLFPQNQVEAILDIYIPLEKEVVDKLVWLKTPSGNFTSKSVYKLLADNRAYTSSESEFPWNFFLEKDEDSTQNTRFYVEDLT